MLKAGISLGRFRGILIRLHYSWFIIFGLVTFKLAAHYFPVVYPHWSLTERVVVGLATSLLFFGSVLAHELAHSLVAQAAGIRVPSITLFILGGLAQIAQEPGRPNVEFRVAMAGPATSLVLGILFVAISAGAAGISEHVAAASFWLGVINIFLALFNLLPGFPLDGGRILRAFIWWRTGNLRIATRIASAIGRGVGYLLILLGIWVVFQGNLLGLLTVLIGWFIQSAAAESNRQVVLQDRLRDYSVSDVMMRDCSEVHPEITLEQLVNEYVLGFNRRCFQVVEGNQALGLMTSHNFKQVPRDLWATKTVGEAMTPMDRLKWVGPDEDLSSVLQLMSNEDINQLPVVDKGNIIGIVALENLLEFIHSRANRRG